jgi:hypothetical protein
VQPIPQQTSYTQQPPIIPQQTNLHDTSQATSRATTPIANFSDAEESNKSDDNDDRLPWQEVKKKWKERTSPKTTNTEKE